ncbi:ABC transporter substrate-binding protein [Actinoplanes utahensis]|uniref:ABC transporter substrate-binding protein n=1 Tax=Actinoplanes utahensis TaxID=1869 RepID=A0A0A6U9R0_ACTUT|nr:ABC transporter substrate-binding protein [Actinoplanes utahensis]KHD72156.1 ABC transporter substrate-binding protein [Actinoplanes utahensis]GIF27597.1 ABC transporter substrate-binding protein [Actinoplanes utahensis]
MKYSQLSLSRRGLLAAGGAVGAGALLAACGGNEETGSSSSSAAPAAAAGPWSFTDDQPKELKADKTPSKIVAFTGTAAALADLGLQDKIVGVFGETKKADGTADPQAGTLDIDKVQIIGNKWGEFSVEKYAALQPDLLITHMYDPGAYWYLPDESKDQILKVAQAATITVGRVPLNKPIERYADLAKSLGADLSAPKVTEAKARFEKAVADLSAAAKASGGIKVLAGSGAADIFYVSNPKVSADLMYFKELGVDIIVPEKTDGGDYFESLSWENANKYHADIIFLDSRAGVALQPNDLASKPGWSALPAVKANQVVPWQSVPIYSWAGSAPLIEALTEAIKKSKKLA